MDKIIEFLSHPFTLIMNWVVWQRALIVLALLLMLVFFLCKVLGRLVQAVFCGGVKGFYFIVCEFLFRVVQNEQNFATVESRNALVARCEKAYDNVHQKKEKYWIRHSGKFILLYILIAGLIALPSVLGSFIPEKYMPVVAFASNLYHTVEAPVLRQAMRTDPLIWVSVSDLKDVGHQNLYREGIQFTCSRGLLEYRDGFFFPETVLTRQELAAMLYHYCGEPKIRYQVDISDAKPNLDTYYSAICWCIEQKILTLTADGAFFPDGQVTYEQFLVALYRYAQATGLPSRATFNLSTLPGSENIQSWATSACQWAAQINILIFGSDGEFRPGEPLPRDSAAELFYRFSVWERSLSTI